MRGTPVAFGAKGPFPTSKQRQREHFIDNLLFRIHFIIVMIKWTGFAQWEFEFPSAGSLTSTLLGWSRTIRVANGSRAVVETCAGVLRSKETSPPPKDHRRALGIVLL